MLPTVPPLPTTTSGPSAAFVLVGGGPALDLVATLGRRHAAPVERIPDPASFGRWLGTAGITPIPPPVDHRDVARARTLRESIYVLVRAAIDGHDPDPAAVDALNRHAAMPDLPVQLIRGSGGRPSAATVDGTAQAALACIARDAVRLLGSPRAQRVKECAHPDCSLVFLDETQSGRRRWCSMDRCGNLVKTAGYRARRAHT
jgi:predicted RNA-binding Zn ribbon-like protein